MFFTSENILVIQNDNKFYFMLLVFINIYYSQGREIRANISCYLPWKSMFKIPDFTWHLDYQTLEYGTALDLKKVLFDFICIFFMNCPLLHNLFQMKCNCPNIPVFWGILAGSPQCYFHNTNCKRLSLFNHTYMCL